MFYTINSSPLAGRYQVSFDASKYFEQLPIVASAIKMSFEPYTTVLGVYLK